MKWVKHDFSFYLKHLKLLLSGEQKKWHDVGDLTDELFRGKCAKGTARMQFVSSAVLFLLNAMNWLTLENRAINFCWRYLGDDAHNIIESIYSGHMNSESMKRWNSLDAIEVERNARNGWIIEMPRLPRCCCFFS